MIPGTSDACAGIDAKHQATAALLKAKMRPAKAMQDALRAAIMAAEQMPQSELDAMLDQVAGVMPSADPTLSDSLKQALANDCFKKNMPAMVQRAFAAASSILDLPSPWRKQLSAALQAATSQILAAAAGSPLGALAMQIKAYEDWVKQHLGPLFAVLDEAFNCLAMVCGQAPTDYASEYRETLNIDESGDFLNSKINEWNTSPTVQQQLSDSWTGVKAKADLIRDLNFG